MNKLMKLGISVLLIAVMLMSVAMPAMASQYDSSYTNKVESVVIERCDGTGTLHVTVACHHTLMSSAFTIQRVYQIGRESLTYGSPLTEGNLKYLNFVGGSITRNLNPSGTFDERFVPGDFLVTLVDGNSAQPEYQLAKIAPCENSYVNFLGHAVSMGGGFICDQIPMEFSSEGNQYSIIFDSGNSLPTDVTVTVTESYDSVVIQAHTEYRYKDWIVDSPAIPAWTQHFGDYEKDCHSQCHYDFAGTNQGDYDVIYVGHTYHPATSHHDAWTEYFGDYRQDGSVPYHYDYVGHNKGDYNVVDADHHVHHPAVPAVAHCSEFSEWINVDPGKPLCDPIRLFCSPPGGCGSDTCCPNGCQESRFVPDTTEPKTATQVIDFQNVPYGETTYTGDLISHDGHIGYSAVAVSDCPEKSCIGKECNIPS